jgi:4-hydroxy-tetrahydrodipicolinate synthase
LLPGLQLGSEGSINGSSIFAPERSVSLYESYRKGNYEEAIGAHEELIPIMSIYNASTPFFLGIKAAVNQRVLKKRSGSREPGLLTEEIEKKVKTILTVNNLN